MRVTSGCVCKCVYGTCLVSVRDASRVHARVSPGVSDEDFERRVLSECADA